MDRNQLRRLVNKAAKTYTDQYRLPHYLSRNQTEPTVLFFPGQDALLHGNFLNASYDVICGNLEWARWLHKPHPRRTALPAKRRAEAMELDSCTSSDALLMNVLCYLGLFLHDPFVRLMGLPATAEPALVFGFKPGVPLRCSRTDATEVDLKVEDLLIEAKLTEKDFTRKRADSATATLGPYSSRPACTHRMATISTISSSATCSPHTTSAPDSGSSVMRGATTSSTQRVTSRRARPRPAGSL